MSPISTRRRSRAAVEDEEEDDEARSHHSTSPKRRRLDGAENDAVTTGSGPSLEESDVTKANPESDFHPGAIVRVSVENFVTYEKAEFFPGPQLNMVIGPNGTGKSSLVCAICLSLGYSPKHLGRAGSVKEYVKHGMDTAIVEIELQKRPKDRHNHVVRLQIRRDQNNQKWWLNGKETNHKTIQALMQSLKIQVDNLCQFLPQDRVVEFAACTPVDLLRETLRAAAPDRMLEWQQQLKELHKEKRDLTQTVQTDTETLSTLKSRQQSLQADVDRIREREEICERVKHLQSALVLAKYNEARTRYSQARQGKKEAERALRRLEQESGPSLEAVNAKQVYAQEVGAALPSLQDALTAAEQQAREAEEESKTAAQQAAEISDSLEAERNSFEAKKKELASSRSKITALQADLKNEPPKFTAAEWNQKIRAEEHIVRDFEQEKRQNMSTQTRIREQGKKMSAEIQRLENEIASLETRRGQQLNQMKKRFPDAAAGWDWLQSHQDDFEKEVFGPPIISCSIRDERYSAHVQCLLQIDDFLSFTVQTKNDFKKLSDLFYREQSLSVVIRLCSADLKQFRAPLDEAVAKDLGLDGFAIDYIEGPAPVLAMLCAEKRLHMGGVALVDHDDATYERLVQNGKINQWAAGTQSYLIRRRREYGPQAMTTISRNIPPGRFWTTQNVDASEKAALDRRLVEVRGEREGAKSEYKELQLKYQAIEDQKSEATQKIETLKKEKNALQREYQKWQSLPDKIESEEHLKVSYEEALRDIKQRILDLQYEWDEAVLKRARLVLKHKDTIDTIRQAHLSLLEARIWLIEANSNVQGLKDRNASIMDRLKEEKEKVQVATAAATAVNQEGYRLQDEVRRIQAEDESLAEVAAQLAEGKEADEIEMDISAEEAKLELIHAANPNAMREFEKRAQEIARIKKKMEGLQGNLGALSDRLKELMDKWEPRLDELVSKISDAFAYNFEQISCASELRVHKDDDFDQWALDIMVKFRENETLQQLTAQRQSGGERAVSTVFYLMALQSLARAPFRVVDEINQGMDPRNERLVHERMVDIACSEHTAQYFLITPKLLTGLRYHPRMRVLCIASGERMPRDGATLDFARCLAVQHRLLAAS